MPGVWEHIPEWWYTLFYTNYQTHYNNNPTQWIQLSTIHQDVQDKTEETKEYYDTIAERKLYEFADRAIDISYLIEKKAIDSLRARFEKVYQLYLNSDTPDCVENAGIIYGRYEEILDNINITNSTHVKNSERRDEYMTYEKDLTHLIALTEKLWFAAKSYNNLKFNH